jgi:hypothetical protein
VAVGSIYHPIHGVLIRQTQTAGRGPLLREYSCINRESFGDLLELVCALMPLASDIPRRAVFGCIAQSLAQFFAANEATSYINLHEKMIAKVLAHRHLFLSDLA